MLFCVIHCVTSLLQWAFQSRLFSELLTRLLFLIQASVSVDIEPDAHLCRLVIGMRGFEALVVRFLDLIFERFLCSNDFFEFLDEIPDAFVVAGQEFFCFSQNGDCGELCHGGIGRLLGDNMLKSQPKRIFGPAFNKNLLSGAESFLGEVIRLFDSSRKLNEEILVSINPQLLYVLDASCIRGRLHFGDDHLRSPPFCLRIEKLFIVNNLTQFLQEDVIRE